MVTLMLPSKPFEVLVYRTHRDRSPFQEWFEKLPAAPGHSAHRGYQEDTIYGYQESEGDVV